MRTKFYPLNLNSRAGGGFTLLEILMALVISALGAVVLGSAYLNVLNSYEVAARGMIDNEDIAHARRILLTEPDRLKLEQGGEFDTADGRRLTWSAEITSSTMPDLFHVAFTCEIGESAGAQPQRITQNLVLLRPTWSIDPAERGKLMEDAKTRILELQEGRARR